MPRKKKEEEQQMDPKPFSLEESFGELDRIIASLEDSGVTLEDSFQLYHKGMDLLKNCNASIDQIEKELLILEEAGI